MSSTPNDSLEIYRQLVENQSDMIVKVDLDGRFLYVSPSCCRTFGKTSEELLGTHFMPLIHEDDREATAKVIEAVKQPPHTAYLERRCCTPEGWRWFSWQNTALLDQNGRVEAIIGVGRDISERRAVKEALISSEKKFRNLFETMQEGFALHEVVYNAAGYPVDYRYLDINPAFERLTGLSREAVVGRRVREVLPQIEEYWIMTFCGVGVSGQPAELENYVAELDRYYRARAYSPEPGKFVVVFEDVTEQKKSLLELKRHEEQLQVLFETSRAGILMVAPSGAITLANTRMTEMLGCSMEELLQTRYPEIVHPDQRSFGDQRMRKLIDGEIDHVATERHFIRKDGSDFWGYLSGRRHEDADGNLVCLVGNITDISELKRSEAAIRESEERYRTLVDNIPLGVSLMDRDYRIIMTNKTQADMFGVTADYFIGKRCHDVFEKRPEPCPHCPGTISMMTGAASHAFTSGFREDGSCFDVQLNTVPLVGGDGEPYGFIEVAEDITERKRAEEALAYASECFQQALNSPQHVLYRMNVKKGRYDYLSPAFERITGHALEQFKQTGIGELREYFHPDDRARVFSQIEEKSATRSGACVNLDLEYRFRKADGSYCWLHDSSTACFDEQGGLEYFIGAAHDITERKRAETLLKESEERYRRLVEQSTAWIWRTDAALRHTFSNENVQKILGYSPEELCAMDTLTLIHPDDHERLAKIVKDAISSRSGWSGVILRWQARGGAWRSIESSGGPLFDENGSFSGLQGVDTDITDRLLLEQEREKGQRLESLGVLAGGIAHDFNNILTGVIGNLSLARHQIGQDHRAAERLDECEKAAAWAGQLTRQLLTFARGGDPVKKIVDLARLLRESLSFGLLGSSVKGVLELDADLWPVDADEGQINQTFNNLLINAAQAMPDGGTVTVTARNMVTDDPPGRCVRLTVRDSGVGIPPEILPRVFDPYFTTKAGGSGLGLASVYSIVTRHGGSVTVASEPGRGTEFVISLPAAGEAVPAVPVNNPDSGESLVAGRVLVMDDEEMIVDVTSMMLEELGCRVDACSNGAEALERYRDALEQGDPYDVIILDLTVPGGMGGLEAARRIREIDPNALLIVSSGYSNDSVMADFRSNGFSGAVVKPYSVDSLVAEVTRVMALRRHDPA